jgi:chitin synthase
MHPPPGYQSGRNTPSGAYAPGVLHQPTPSRPATAYLDVQIPVSGSPEDVDLAPGMPSDIEIDRSVQRILQDADLTTVTKREIRRQLEEQYSMDLSSRKAAINAAIDRVLLARAG